MEVQQEEIDRGQQLLDTQDGLRYLAKLTGGIAIVNNNDLSGGIRKILDDQSYYLIAYEPDDSTFDPRTRRFNNLQIKLTRPGAQARYRSNFFGVSDEKLVKPVQTVEQRIVDALTSPFAVNEISLKLNALFYKSPEDGLVIRSLMHVRAQDLKFTDEPDGSKKLVFDIIAKAFGDNGAVVGGLERTYTVPLKKEEFEKMMKTGFVYDLPFPIDKPGAYQLRVALHDHGSDKIGSANQFVEVPNLKKGRLTVSGVALENLEYADWKKREDGRAAMASDTLADTSLRQFKRGTVLSYGFSIYNAKGGGAVPKLSYRTRVYRDGKPVFDNPVKPIVPATSDPKSVDFAAALSLGTAMVPGDYVLEITVIDNLAKGKENTSTQFVQFEIVD